MLNIEGKAVRWNHGRRFLYSLFSQETTLVLQYPQHNHIILVSNQHTLDNDVTNHQGHKFTLVELEL